MSFWNKKKVVVLNYDVNDKSRKSRKKYYVFPIIIFALIVALWGIVSVSTTDNFISIGAKKILSKAGIYTKPVEKSFIESNDSVGGWTLSKEANWIDSSTAKVTLKLNSEIISNEINKDIIIVIDTSESMNGSRLEVIKDETKKVLNQVLNNESNRVAIISYNNNSNVVSDFVSDKELLIEKISSIQTGNNTNYYAGLKSIFDVLNNYSYEDNRELVTIFIADGKPNKATPNEKNIYKALKEKYPYIKMYGIQYEMNFKKAVTEIKNITDEQWIANQSNFGEVLKETLSFTDKYEEMNINDYINTKYFKILDDKNIVSSIGTTKITEENGLQKLTWNLSDKYATGSVQTLSFNVALKDEYQDQAGLYPIIKRENVKYSINDENKNVTNYETPVLNTKYDVIYDVNSPKECSIKNLDSEEKIIFQNVNIKNEQLSCNEYIFNGWEIVDTDIKKINDSVFVMPGHDVTIRAIWTKQQLNLSMDGQVYQSSKIYKVLEDSYNNKTNVEKYTGEHNDSLDNNSTKDIYYFKDKSDNNYTINEKNNVLFANHCWKIIRTTDNGGVRLIYNGEPDENYQCGNERQSHIIIRNIIDDFSINTNWYYSNNYTYDAINKKIILGNDKKKYDSTNYQELNGKYTCAFENENDTCQTMYYIQNVNNQTNAKVVVLGIDNQYNQIASASYNQNSDSAAYVGYKYGEVYKNSNTSFDLTESITNKEVIINSTTSKNKQILFSDEIIYNNNLYSLVNPTESIKQDDESLKNKYTMFKTDNQNDYKVYQIIGVDNNNVYYVELNNGVTKYNTEISIASSYKINNGKIELIDSKNISLRDWFENSNEYKNNYLCTSQNSNCNNIKYVIDSSKGTATTIDSTKTITVAKARNGLQLIDSKEITYEQLITNGKSLADEGYKYTCNNNSTLCTDDEIRLITAYTNEGYKYVSNFYFAASVTWDGTNYTLQNIVDFENYNNLSMIDNHHYICIEPGKKKCDKVAYIYGYKDGTIYYTLLENGVINITKAKENMFMNNINDSNAKKIVEAWYELNLKKYSTYIDENAIYCNNRKENDNKNGWIELNSSLKDSLKFKGNDMTSNNLDCENITDQFSYNNEYAKLNYPIGLATSQELSLSSKQQSELFTNSYWTMTPSEINNINSMIKVFDENNNNGEMNTHSTLSIRPVITLKENAEFDDGDGSTMNPYHINVGEE